MEQQDEPLMKLLEQVSDNPGGDEPTVSNQTLLSYILQSMKGNLEQSERISTVENNVKSIEKDIENIEDEVRDIKNSYDSTRDKRAAFVEKGIIIFVSALFPILITLMFNR